MIQLSDLVVGQTVEITSQPAEILLDDAPFGSGCVGRRFRVLSVSDPEPIDSTTGGQLVRVGFRYLGGQPLAGHLVPGPLFGTAPDSSIGAYLREHMSVVPPFANGDWVQLRPGLSSVEINAAELEVGQRYRVSAPGPVSAWWILCADDGDRYRWGFEPAHFPSLANALELVPAITPITTTAHPVDVTGLEQLRFVLPDGDPAERAAISEQFQRWMFALSPQLRWFGHPIGGNGHFLQHLDASDLYVYLVGPWAGYISWNQTHYAPPAPHHTFHLPAELGAVRATLRAVFAPGTTEPGTVVAPVFPALFNFSDVDYLSFDGRVADHRALLDWMDVEINGHLPTGQPRLHWVSGDSIRDANWINEGPRLLQLHLGTPAGLALSCPRGRITRDSNSNYLDGGGCRALTFTLPGAMEAAKWAIRQAWGLLAPVPVPTVIIPDVDFVVLLADQEGDNRSLLGWMERTINVGQAFEQKRLRWCGNLSKKLNDPSSWVTKSVSICLRPISGPFVHFGERGHVSNGRLDNADHLAFTRREYRVPEQLDEVKAVLLAAFRPELIATVATPTAPRVPREVSRRVSGRGRLVVLTVDDE